MATSAAWDDAARIVSEDRAIYGQNDMQYPGINPKTVAATAQTATSVSNSFHYDDETEGQEDEVPPLISFSYSSSLSPSSELQQQQQQEEQQERLHENIEELKDLIKEAKRRYREEKKRRRKMDNAVTKLSHELTRRDQQSKVGQQRIKEMEDENLHLEQDWATMLEERDLIVRDHNDFGGNYQLQIAEEKAKYQTLLQQHEMALSEMKRNHQHQCHNLCELILKADREADQLRQQLQGDNNEALPSPKAFRSADNESRSKFRLFTRKALVSVLITLLGILYYKGNQVELFTKDGMCSPIIPGRVLTAQTASNAMRFEAPWWAPVSMKQSAFTKLCINQSNAFLENSFFSPVVEWKDPDKKGGRFKNQQKSLVITTAEGNENVKCSEAERVEFSGTKILVWCQTGKKTTIEEIAFPYR